MGVVQSGEPIEIHSITTYDGEVYLMDNALERAVLQTPAMMGLPPIEYLTRKGYKQDGETEIGTNIQSRVFTVMYRYSGLDRASFWEARYQLLEACRPNRGGPLTFTIRYGDMTERSIVARAYDPQFKEGDPGTWDENGYTETLTFIAHDPFWFNPTQTVVTLGVGSGLELAFDIAFDGDGIYFDDDNLFNIATIDYPGSIYSYPVIEIDGPFSAATVQHQELGLFIQVLDIVGYGGTLVIDLVNGTIQTTSGLNYFTKLAPGSNLAQFRLEPHPIVANGRNTILFTLNNYVLGFTAVRINYYEKWIGI